MWTRELAIGLRVAAKRVLAREYSWFNHANCNCGMLAQAVDNVAAQVICANLQKMYEMPVFFGWSYAIEQCAASNLPMASIARRLAAVGLTDTDLADLELLRNNQIRARIGLESYKSSATDDCTCSTATSVSAYMSAWADMIDEQLNVEQETTYEEDAPCGQEDLQLACV